MIVTELLEDGRIRQYSDEYLMLKQVETGILYEDAIDIQPCPYTYEETDIPIRPATAEELLDIIVGSEAL